MSWRDDERKAMGEAYETPPPAEYEAYLQERLARWAVEDLDDSETPEEEVARREKRARVTQAAVNRYLLNFAEYGRCGDPIRSEPGNLDIALAYAEEAEADDLAVAEPLRDLHWILKEGDSEACAKAVGSAWRAQHPFRLTRAGDPYEMLTPQNDRVRAMIALDQAARLVVPPTTALIELDAFGHAILSLPNPVVTGYCTNNECREDVARELALQALQAANYIYSVPKPTLAAGSVVANWQVAFNIAIVNIRRNLRDWLSNTLSADAASTSASIANSAAETVHAKVSRAVNDNESNAAALLFANIFAPAIPSEPEKSRAAWYAYAMQFESEADLIVKATGYVNEYARKASGQS